jgi:hypothetical protein
LVSKIRTGDITSSRKIDGVHSLREHIGLTVLAFFLTEFMRSEFVPAINNRNYDDGVIADRKDGTFFPIEQVYVYEKAWDNNVIDGVKVVLNKKISKGSEYAKNNWLLIFCNAIGTFNPDWLEEYVSRTNFETIIIFGPTGETEFSYTLYVLKFDNKISKLLYGLSISPEGKSTLIDLN